MQRISRVAHRAEDLIGRLRDGALRPSAEIIDICLEAVDALKRFLYRQWPDEASMHSAVQALFIRIGRLVPEEQDAPLETRAAEATPQPQAEERPILELAAEVPEASVAEVAAPVAEIEPPAEERSPLVKTGHAEAAKDADLKKEPAGMP